ncbi:MAG TPA: ATP-binding cassette domain-containing protein [Longimicrobiales bacterium]
MRSNDRGTTDRPPVTEVTPLDRRRIAWPDVRRGGRLVLRGHEVVVPGSAVVGIMGVNGAGKSTLMLQLAGLLRSARPRAGVAADAATVDSTTAFGHVGFAPQHAALPAWLTATEIARMFGLDISDLHRQHPAMRLDELVDTPATKLSVGQQQAVSVAIALAGDAPLVLLDEPFAPLDFRRRIALTEILRQHVAGRVIMISTQSAAELSAVCSWVLVLREGRCVFSGPIAALTGPASDGERAVQRLEKRIMDMLDSDVSGSRIPSACHPP